MADDTDTDARTAHYIRYEQADTEDWKTALIESEDLLTEVLTLMQEGDTVSLFEYHGEVDIPEADGRMFD